MSTALLAIECIGDDTEQFLRSAARAYGPLSQAVVGHVPASHWCAEIIGWALKYKYERRFLRCQKDYSNANSMGSRGVMAYYV